MSADTQLNLADLVALLYQIPASRGDPQLDRFVIGLQSVLRHPAELYASRYGLDAEELLQDFLTRKLLENDHFLDQLNAIQDDDPVSLAGHRSAYLLQSLKNLARDMREHDERQGARRRARMVEYEPLRAPHPSAEEELLEQERRQRVITEVRALIEQLPETQRDALRLRFIKELPHETIAGLTGAGSSNAVTTRVKRALSQLRRRWRGGGEDGA